MKRLAVCLLLISFFAACVAGQSSLSLETSIYNELNAAYNSGFYPGVVENAELLQSDYPQSSLLADSNCKKGEALFLMQQYKDAILVFEKLLPETEQLPQIKARTIYLLAQSYEKNGQYEKAIKYYAECAEFCKNSQAFYFNQSVLKAGQVYFNIKDFEKAENNFEYVIKNGKEFLKKDYNDALQKLFVSYNSQKKYKKSIELFVQLNKEDFPEQVYYSICIYAADAYKELDENIKSYETYCTAIEGGLPDLAVVALKKAYVLSGEKKIGVNPADVFSKTAETFKENPGLVREFWIRLAIDEYNKADFKGSADFLENALAVEGDTSFEAAVITLYQAKIRIDGYEDFSGAEQLLEQKENQLILDKYNVYDSWYSALLSCKVNLKKWSEVPDVYKKIQNPGITEKYQLSSYFYNEKQYKNAISLLSEICENDKFAKYDLCDVLYASALLKNGDYAKACRIYEISYLNGKLNNQNKLEYSKGLFFLKNYKKSYELAVESKTVEGQYVAGLNLVNLQVWKSAKECFISYIKDKSKVENFNVLSYFYKGYCEYCLEDYKNAYVSYVRFTNDGKNADYKYLKEAYDLSSKAALQYEDYGQAALQAENLVKHAISEKEKQNAVIYLCDIYCDAKRYSSAIELLEPYVAAKNDFTMTALFKTAQVYEKQNDLNGADKVYEKIYTEYPKGEYAQDAMYRSGELFYSHEDFASSQKRFNKYIYKYPEGKYADSALYFCGDCDLKLGRYDECVMLNTTLLSKYQESSYVYAANKNLLSAYYEQEYFNKALEVARLLVKEFPEQAANEGIGKKLIQLEKIVSGTDKSVAEKLGEYEKAGKTSTFEGRKTGLELVQLYAQKDSSMADAVSLAQEILENHKEDSQEELLISAKTAEFLGDYYEKTGRNQSAGETYLSAAQFYRGSNEDDKAATCLYSAADSFIKAGQNGNAKEVVDLLQQLYPDSKQAKAGSRLLK